MPDYTLRISFLHGFCWSDYRSAWLYRGPFTHLAFLPNPDLFSSASQICEGTSLHFSDFSATVKGQKYLFSRVFSRNGCCRNFIQSHFLTSYLFCSFFLFYRHLLSIIMYAYKVFPPKESIKARRKVRPHKDESIYKILINICIPKPIKITLKFSNLHLITLPLWAFYLTSLNLRFFCKLEIMVYSLYKFEEVSEIRYIKHFIQHGFITDDQNL